MKGPLCGVRVDGPKGPKVLRVLKFDSGLGPLRVVVAAKGPLRDPGSEGSKGSKGSKGCGIALSGDEYEVRVTG